MCSGLCSIAWPTQAICQAVRTGSPRSGAIRLDMCSTSGQLVRTASRTPARITHRSSARPISGEAAHRRSRRSTGAVEGLSISVLAIRGGAYGRRLLPGAAGEVSDVAYGGRSLGPCRRPDLRHTEHMRVLVVGSGGVGAAFAAIAQRRPVFTQVVMADVALERAQAVAERLGEPDRFGAERVDASSEADLVEL